MKTILINARLGKYCKNCHAKLGCRNKSELCRNCYVKNYMRNYNKVHKQRDKKYREMHKQKYKDYREIHKQQIKDYRDSRKKIMHKYNVEYYHKDIKKSRERNTNNYHKDIEESRMRNRLRRHNNKLKINERERNNYHKDVEKSRRKIRAEHLKRRLLTPELIQQVYEHNIRENGVLTCYLCGIPIAFKGKNLKFIALGRDNLEHKIPICRGGTHALDNMDIAHAICNLSKGIRTYQECLEQHIIFPPELLKEVA